MVTIAVTAEPADEPRVAVSPETVKKLVGLGAHVKVEAGAGARSRFSDDALRAQGAEIVATAADALRDADILLKVRRPSAADVAALKPGALVVAMLDPYGDSAALQALAGGNAALFSMEFMPRITRAQSMDVLSSQANLAGYKAVVDAAAMFQQAMPMMMTAAGTVPAAKVFVMGAGVAGLQAIATARRLGAQVEGFDVRPETKEQIESLGAKFLDLGVSAAGEGGYARELTAEERAEQQRRLAEHLKGIDVVVTTAAVPGRAAPKIITAAMVQGMKAGAVIVDLAAETGGNCELTKPGETVDVGGVTIVGPTHLASRGAIHASEMYARNLFNFLSLMLKEGELAIDWEDDLIQGCCLTHAGEIRHAPTKTRVEGAA